MTTENDHLRKQILQIEADMDSMAMLKKRISATYKQLDKVGFSRTVCREVVEQRASMTEDELDAASEDFMAQFQRAQSVLLAERVLKSGQSDIEVAADAAQEVEADDGAEASEYTQTGPPVYEDGPTQ